MGSYMVKKKDDLNKRRVRWIRALESGDFEQTRFTLQDKLTTGATGYCCLGVADVIGPNEDLYTEINEFYGLSDSDENQCVAWNDTEKLTFSEIAANLRAKWGIENA